LGKAREESFQILDEDLRVVFRRPKRIVQGTLFVGVRGGWCCGLRRAQRKRPTGPQQTKAKGKL
jgi:hypothetical protein